MKNNSRFSPGVFYGTGIALVALTLIITSLTIRPPLTEIQDRKNSQQTPIKIVLFDVGNVLVKTSSLKLIKTIGFWDITWYTISQGKNPFTLTDTVKDFIKTWSDQEGYTVVNGLYATAAHGVPLPLTMEAWQKGQISSNQFLEKLLKHVEIFSKDSSELEKKLLIKCAHVIANPLQQMETKQALYDVVDIVKEIRNQHDQNGNRKFKLVILSNMEKDLVPHMRKEYKEIFELFDDHIFSGEINMIKPHKEIYDHVIKKHKVAHHECYFIDDLDENIRGACDCGWKTFHFHKQSSPADLRSDLQKAGILI